MKIFVVDDEKEMRDLLKKALERHIPDCEVSTFDSPTSAIAALSQGKPDRIITDWNMPGGGGQAVIEAAKKAGVPDKKIFVISGDRVSPEEAKANLENASGLKIGGCLLKPFRLQKILDMLK